MKYAVSLLNWIKANKVLSLFILLFGLASTAFILREQAKVKCESCKPYQDIAESLIEAFSEKETVYEAVQSDFQFAVYLDTTKPMTKTELQKYRDSVLAAAKRKLDSLKKK